MDLLVSAVMRKDVFTVSSSLTLRELEGLFVEHRVSGFPVVDDGNLVGVVSNSDVIRALHPNFDLTRSPPPSEHAVADSVGQIESKLLVKDVMTVDVVTVSKSDHLHDAADYMYNHRIHRVFVMEEGRLVGILTPFDFVRLYSTDRIKTGVAPARHDF